MSRPTKSQLRQARLRRVRAKIRGTSLRPRMSVHRSLTAIRVQLIDDTAGKTLVAARTSELKAETATEGKTTKVSAAHRMGTLIAERAKAKGITHVVFDRAGYRFHGRVAAVAEGARAGGLQF